MTAVLLGVALILPIAAAYAGSRLVFRGEADVATRALRLGIAVPLGLGAGSLLSYGWLVAGGALGTGYAVADGIAFAGALALGWAGRSRAEPQPERGPGHHLDRVALAAAALAVVVLVAAGATLVNAQPHGDWDAWTIWNLRARFLLRAGPQWRVAFDEAFAFSHNEYPLLLPVAVARLWSFSGETPAAPALVGLGCTAAATLVIFGAVARQAGHVAGAVAALLLVATAGWTTAGAAQYADVPLACCVVAAGAVFAAAGGPGEARLVALGGALLGLAAWTKEEGVMLAAVFAAWAALRPAGLSSARRALAIAAGAALPLAARVHFQATLAPSFASDFTVGQGLDASLERLLAVDRWRFIAVELPQRLPGAAVWLPAIAVAAAALLGARWRELPRSPALPAALAWCAYTVVYAITPKDLDWHIGTSAARVLLQPWPALLLGLFSLVPGARADQPAPQP